MRGLIFRGRHILSLALLLAPLFAVEAPARAVDRTPRAESFQALPESKNQIIKLGQRGLDPEILRMRREDSIVFFFNNTDDALVSLEVDFGEHRSHCSSSNMRLENAGKLRSTRPFGPNDFSSMCFHDAGRYAFTIYGLPSKPAGAKGEIIVE